MTSWHMMAKVVSFFSFLRVGFLSFIRFALVWVGFRWRIRVGLFDHMSDVCMYREQSEVDIADSTVIYLR